MRRFLLIFAAVAVISSCSGHQEGICVINGTIDDPDNRDGEWIFLVPQGPHEDSEVDSTIIDKGKFTFVTDNERMSVIRVTKFRRIGLQDLLVVTEPGLVEVSIAASGCGGGTPQNDSLQLWKSLTEDFAKVVRTISDKQEMDSVRAAYIQRTRQLAHNCGDSTTLGKFLLSLYPDKKSK